LQLFFGLVRILQKLEEPFLSSVLGLSEPVENPETIATIEYQPRILEIGEMA
jgi:hypothetical protein